MPDGQAETAEVEGLLGNIEAELVELGGDDRVLDAHLDIATDVLGRPDEHLWVRKESLILDRMAIRHSEPADGTQEVVLDLVCDSDELSLVCMPVAISRDTFQSSYTA
jgi:hypothetical protein